MNEARYALKLKQTEAVRDITLSVINNPIVALVGGFLAVEYFQKKTFDWGPAHAQKNQYDAILGSTAGGLLEGAMVTTAMINGLSKAGVFQAMINQGEGNAKNAGSVVKDVMPLLLASGALA
jgi:hypothetical protein